MTDRIKNICWGILAMSSLIIMIAIIVMHQEKRGERQCLGTSVRTECIDGYAYAFKFFTADSREITVLVPLWDTEGKPRRCEVYSDFDKSKEIPEK